MTKDEHGRASTHFKSLTLSSKKQHIDNRFAFQSRAPMPSRAEIAEQDRDQLKRQRDFRVAADAVAAALSEFAEVQAIALFGSVARPLAREVPRFQPYRRLGIEILHECKDVDLAVWLTRTDRLRDLSRARGRALAKLFPATGIGVAQHQVDVFLFAADHNRYLGRLCYFAQCPKGKPDCRVEGCGAIPFLKQHENFVLAANALSAAVNLFDRRTGTRSNASELPQSRHSAAC
jgi:hypothetical protein